MNVLLPRNNSSWAGSISRYNMVLKFMVIARLLIYRMEFCCISVHKNMWSSSLHQKNKVVQQSSTLSLFVFLFSLEEQASFDTKTRQPRLSYYALGNTVNFTSLHLTGWIQTPHNKFHLPAQPQNQRFLLSESLNSWIKCFDTFASSCYLALHLFLSLSQSHAGPLLPVQFCPCAFHMVKQPDKEHFSSLTLHRLLWCYCYD